MRVPELPLKTIQGVRIARESMRFAPSSFTKRSFAGSHVTLRPRRIAISLIWQIVSDRTDSSMGDTASLRVLTQSMKFRWWCGLRYSRVSFGASPAETSEAGWLFTMPRWT